MELSVEGIPLKDRLKRFSRLMGIEIIGVADASPFIQLQRVLRERDRDGYRSPFEEKGITLRCDPDRVMPGARSIIAVAVPYSARRDAGLAGLVEGEIRGKPRGWISMSAWGKDYHFVVGSILRRLSDFLAQNSPRPVQVATFVDRGPLVDRAIAQRAGIGWYGKNCSIFTRKYGSWVFLGEILTDLELEPDIAGSSRLWSVECEGCDTCLRACPTGALDPRRPYVTNANICLSYITQMRGFIPRDLRRKMGVRLYGCDTCQSACPKNKAAPFIGLAEFWPRNQDEVAPDLLNILNLSNSEFKEIYGWTSAGWRGRTTLQRNAVIALGNLRDDYAVDLAIPVLKDCLDDPRPVIRGHAAWALGAIGGARGRRYLEGRYRQEDDERVREEIMEALG